MTATKQRRRSRILTWTGRLLRLSVRRARHPERVTLAWPGVVPEQRFGTSSGCAHPSRRGLSLRTDYPASSDVPGPVGSPEQPTRGTPDAERIYPQPSRAGRRRGRRAGRLLPAGIHQGAGPARLPRDEGFSLPTQREANQRKAGGSPAFPGGSVGRRRLLAFPLSSLTPTVELHHLVGH